MSKATDEMLNTIKACEDGDVAAIREYLETCQVLVGHLESRNSNNYTIRERVVGDLHWIANCVAKISV